MYDPNLPYRSARAPVAAANLVATSQPLAVQAGLRAMQQGGNAMDAALAAAITLTVVEPNNNGLGSDAFCILWDGAEVVGLNASGRSPAGWTAERFRGLQKMPELGWDSVTVPGAVSSWVKLSGRYGRLAFADLFESAIEYAEGGFLVGPETAFYWQLLESHYAGFAAFAEHFLPAPRAGQLFKRPDLARSLRLIAETKGAAFYQGELAEAMVAASDAQGGCLSMQDLAAHAADWVAPISQAFKHIELHEIPPNGQGLAAQIALGILQHLPDQALDSAAEVHQQIEAMKIATATAAGRFADAEAMTVSAEELLDTASLRQAAASIGTRAMALPPVVLPVGHDTVYLTTADASGMMVSYIQSNFRAFGSGIVIPGTGIAMQNRGSGFVLDSDHVNAVGPNKRPFHTIIPGFVTANGRPEMAFGVMGGHMQHQGHVQMVNRVFGHGQNPQAASDAPRWHVYEDFSVGLESGFDPKVAEELEARGHKVRFDKRTSTFGGAQLIQRLADGYVGGSDHRKEGLVAGF